MVSVYALALPAALCFAVGSVLQQRAAAKAPREGLLRLALLGWLVRRPVWLGGTALFLVGNVLTASALGRSTLALVEPLQATRLLFALPVEAVVDRRRLIARDWVGAVLAAAGISTFVMASHPRSGRAIHTPVEVWAVLGAVAVAATSVVVVLGRRLPPARSAPLLAAGAGVLFACQAAATGPAVRRLHHRGVVGLLSSWYPYAVAAAAIYGAVLLQSAYEEADLTASFPALVVAEPIAALAIGVGALGDHVRDSAAALAVGVLSLGAMVAGIYLLASSPSASAPGSPPSS